MFTAAELRMLCATEKKAASFLDMLSTPAFGIGGAALGGLAGAGISTAMTGKPHLGAIIGGELGGLGLGGLYAYHRARSGGRKELDALRSKRKEELSKQDLLNMQVLADMENELSPSEIQTKKTAADLGRLSAQMHHTKQAEGWSDLPSWLFSLGGHNPFFKQPQQGMGGPVVMPGLNGGRNQLPRQPNMGGPVVMPGFNGGGQPKGPTPPAFDLMPFVVDKTLKVPKDKGYKTMPAPIPTNKAPKTPAIKLL